MCSKAQILVFSDFPDEGEGIAQAIRKVSDRDVQAVIDPMTAFEMLGTQRPEIVFAHLQAGAVAATAFLNEVWTRNPQTTRFLVGDSTRDSDALVRCALGPHQFIPGPMDPEKVDAALSRADSIKRFVQNEKIRQVVSRMRTLPNRPALSIEIMRELRSTHASASVVGELVSRDVAISSKLIQIANSAFYRAEQQVSNPVEAVLLIGLETTAALVVSIETFAQLDKLKPLYFSMDRVWKHCQSVAELAVKISRTLGYDAETTANVYTAGLLHDVGKLALALNFEEDYDKVLKDTEKKSLPVHQLEEDFFGASHAETGAYLLALWGMPLPIVQAVAGHHWPIGKLNEKLPAVTALRLANQLVNTPENLDAILAEYPAELGLLPRLRQLRALLGTKARPEKQGKPAVPNSRTAENNSNATTASANRIPRPRRAFYLAAGAMAALVLFAAFSWPRILPRLQSQAQLEANASEKHPSSKADDAKTTHQPPNDNNASTPRQPVTLTQPIPFEQPLTLDLPFPFDQLFPTEDSVPKHSPEL